MPHGMTLRISDSLTRRQASHRISLGASQKSFDEHGKKWRRGHEVEWSSSLHNVTFMATSSRPLQAPGRAKRLAVADRSLA